MLANPDHKVIKQLAREMLLRLDHCPAGLQKICNELLPIAQFANGFTDEVNQRSKIPPTTVMVELEGQRWIAQKHRRNWRRI